MIFELFLWLRQNSQQTRIKRLEDHKRQLEHKIARLEASQTSRKPLDQPDDTIPPSKQ